MSVNCVYCGHVNPDGTTVCQSCGRTLPPPAPGGSYGQAPPWGAPQQPQNPGGSYPPPADPYGTSYPPPGGQGGGPSYGNSPGYGSYGQQPGYGADPYAQGAGAWGVPPGGAMAGGFNNPAVTDAQSEATKAMIFSIAGILCCFILGIVGIMKGGKAKTTLQQFGVQEGQTQATVAIVLGYVSIGLFVLGIVFNVLAVLAQ
jgi:hypothetical protein